MKTRMGVALLSRGTQAFCLHRLCHVHAHRYTCTHIHSDFPKSLLGGYEERLYAPYRKIKKKNNTAK